MSTIPAGLRIDIMRKRMEDKATIQHKGGMYVGSTNYNSDISAYETVELFPALDGSDNGFPLVSNGNNAVPTYQQLSTDGLANESVTKDKLGNGTIVASDSSKHTLTISTSGDFVTINYTTN